jgi:hypothetical protein
MDSAGQTISLDQISDLVVEKLTQSGTLAKLGSANLEAIEEETILSVDQITRDVISKLLGKQAQIIEAYQQATLPQQQHGQPDDAPQNDWTGRVAVVQGDGGRAQTDDLDQRDSHRRGAGGETEGGERGLRRDLAGWDR